MGIETVLLTYIAEARGVCVCLLVSLSKCGVCVCVNSGGRGGGGDLVDEENAETCSRKK